MEDEADLPSLYWSCAFLNIWLASSFRRSWRWMVAGFTLGMYRDVSSRLFHCSLFVVSHPCHWFATHVPRERLQHVEDQPSVRCRVFIQIIAPLLPWLVPSSGVAGIADDLIHPCCPVCCFRPTSVISLTPLHASFHLRFGRPLLILSGMFTSSILLTTCSSFILLTWPYHFHSIAPIINLLFFSFPQVRPGVRINLFALLTWFRHGIKRNTNAPRVKLNENCLNNEVK